MLYLQRRADDVGLYIFYMHIFIKIAKKNNKTQKKLKRTTLLFCWFVLLFSPTFQKHTNKLISLL